MDNTKKDRKLEMRFLRNNLHGNGINFKYFEEKSLSDKLAGKSRGKNL